MKNKLTCFIVDDEKPAHVVLETLIAKIPWLELTGKFFNAIDAMEAFERQQPGLIFLDINMPELTGTELLDILKLNKTQVIMTTAYPQYAVDGFKFDVTGFLLKPIGFDKFLKATSKVKMLAEALEKRHNKPEVAEVEIDDLPSLSDEPIKAVIETNPPEGMGGGINDDFLWVRADRKLFRVFYNEIFHVEGLKDYVKVYHKDGMLIMHGSVSTMEAQLPPKQFIRVHRSYIVNRMMIKIIDGNTLVLENNEKIPMTANNRDELIGKITGGKFR
ncbi:LytR/AlgR family response regulator transcription factor [Emticicia sp. 17c]|uniref:LytR/AlgR family response regulator transcription factor n=1 Tax=Emticicia sp. 17c TaxID=3127704 RepID=UPI00301C673D